MEGEPPTPRAHFTATKFFNKIMFFGGYGGHGDVFNDVFVLHVTDEIFVWENITESIGGMRPAPRFDHCAFIYPVTPNSKTFDKLLLIGGRDLAQMFHDAHVLDLATMCWDNKTQPPCLSSNICLNLSSNIESVPYHKIFSFGGKTDMMMAYNSQVDVMDAGNLIWQQPLVESNSNPTPR